VIDLLSCAAIIGNPGKMVNVLPLEQGACNAKMMSPAKWKSVFAFGDPLPMGLVLPRLVAYWCQ